MVAERFQELARPGGGSGLAPVVTETYWGYVARPADAWLRRAARTELLALLAGVAVLLAAAGLWLLPGGGAFAAPGVRAAATPVFAVLGVGLIWSGRTGLVQEMHVDLRKRELRLVRRNRSGEGRRAARIPFAEVVSLVLLRPAFPLLPARLCLRRADGRLVCILPSVLIELIPLRDRLAGDLSAGRSAAPARPARRMAAG